MKIYQEESKVYYEIEEQKSGIKLFDSKSNRTYIFKESYEALWQAIELMRYSWFENLSEENLSDLSRHFHFSTPLTKNVLPSLKKEKVNRSYYDQVFMKLLSQYRSGKEEVRMNASHFMIHLEVIHLLKKVLGMKPMMNPVQV
jgi:hypothetical protein